MNLNQWVLKQRAPGYRDRLRDDQRKRLEDLPDWSWAHRQRSWAENLAALADYTRRRGTATPPVDYRSADGFPIGRWVADLRSPYRQKRLSIEHRNQLEKLPGWSWETSDKRVSWSRYYQALSDFAAHTGHSSPPVDHHTADGLRLGHWVAEQRRRRGSRGLSAHKQQLLAALPGWTWPF